MPEAPPGLLEEQARLMPRLDRLLALAALWMDPPMRGEEALQPPGADAGETPPTRLVVPQDPVVSPPSPGSPSKAAAAAAPPASNPISSPARGLSPGDATAAGDSVAATPPPGSTPLPAATLRSAEGPAARQSRPASSDEVARSTPVMPPANLAGIAARAAALGTSRPGAGMQRRGGMTAPAVAPFAAVTAGFDAWQNSLASPAPPSLTQSDASEATRPWRLAFATGAANAPRHALGPSPAAMPATGTTDPSSAPALPDDLLEDRLADLLERVATEVGIALP